MFIVLDGNQGNYEKTSMKRLEIRQSCCRDLTALNHLGTSSTTKKNTQAIFVCTIALLNLP